MLRILFCIISFTLLGVSPSVSARYLITWDDFNKTEERCWQECVQSHWEEVTHCQIICGEVQRMSPSLRVTPLSPMKAKPSMKVKPSAAGDCTQECWTDYVQVCDRYEQKCGLFRVPLPDGDMIDITITAPNASGLPNNIIEVVLESGAQVTWWKAINIHSQGTDTEIWNQDNVKSTSVRLDANDFRNALWIEFKKAKFLGAHTGMYDLKQLDRIEPGSRVTFSWVKD